MTRLSVALVTGLIGLFPLAGAAQPRTGFTAVDQVAAAYDTILDAGFDDLPAIVGRLCPPAPEAACRVLEARNLWWQVQLDPVSRALDPALGAAIERAIAEADAFTRREPSRAEAWFYLGAAFGARAEFHVLREERLAAARDGKRIKSALDKALALDPAMHDADFGIGIYRYYADVAPAVVKFLRWLLLLPGGDRADGLRRIEQASREGVLVGGEALYQLHLIDLWYESRVPDALAIVRGLERRYPHNPLFRRIEAEVLDVYVHDHAASLAASRELLRLAEAGEVRRAALAATVARLNLAAQHAALGDRGAALAELDTILAARPSAPADAIDRARALRRAIAGR